MEYTQEARLLREIHRTHPFFAWTCVKGKLIPILVETGVKQGDLLAPTPFAILFTETLFIAFAESNVGIYIL